MIYNAMLISVYSKHSNIYIFMCIYIYIHTHTHLKNVLFHYGSSKNTEYSSLCYTKGPCFLSILYINIIVCIYSPFELQFIRTHISYITGRFFTIWTTRKAPLFHFVNAYSPFSGKSLVTSSGKPSELSLIVRCPIP